MQRSKGGRVEKLVGGAEAIGPRGGYFWEWDVRLGQERLASGTAPDRRTAVRMIDRSIRKALAAIPAYCIIAEESGPIGHTEYVHVVDLFIPRT